MKKVVLWRILSTLIILFLSYLFFGEIGKSFAMVLLFAAIMTTLHYFYEKWWGTIEDKKIKKVLTTPETSDIIDT